MYPIKDFNHQAFITAAEELLRSDETARALNLLDNLPAFYRIQGNEPQEITALRQEIMKWIATPSFYANHRGVELEMGDHCNEMIGTLRGKLLAEDVRRCNENGSTPLIVDLGPGEFWAPQMLKHQGLSFYYEPIFVNSPSYNHYLKKFDDVLLKTSAAEFKAGPKIFFAGEILEHLWQPMDIRFEMQKIGACDVAHVTTPNCTFNPNVTNWRNIGHLGHLHAINFDEFRILCQKLFKEYTGAFYESQILHARFVKTNSQYCFLKTHYEIKL